MPGGGKGRDMGFGRAPRLALAAFAARKMAPSARKSCFVGKRFHSPSKKKKEKKKKSPYGPDGMKNLLHILFTQCFNF